jgi:hypothetical protein
VVNVKGPVIDARSGKPVAAKIAQKARQLVREHRRGQGEGQPPRRGPTDNLRKLIFFGVDEQSQSVVIGPMRFASQPPMNRASIPELLNRGGVEEILGKRVVYGPRPFVETTLPIAEKKFHELIEKTRLGP